MRAGLAARERLLIVVVVLAQLLDTFTFLPAVARVGISAERNVLVRHLYSAIGPAGPLLLKIAAIGVLLAALAWVHRRYPRHFVPIAIGVVLVGLLGAWSNIAFGLMA